jgi:ubiquinone/menaquinone biosynthesis C-methylase UbiE
VNPEDDVKSCCARLYESDFVRLLLGESFHPGGLKLTSRLGEMLQLMPNYRVLDVACGKGASATHIAEGFRCEVVGIDYSEENVRYANQSANDRLRFEQADSERLPFEDASFDVIICECAFCTFPDKATAAREFLRVLKPGGRVGLSDLTRACELPPDLTMLLAWVACIADAQPADTYVQIFMDAGFCIDCVENHDDALREMVHQIRLRLLGVKIAVGLEKLNLPDLDLTAAKRLSDSALQAVAQGQLGYAIITAMKPVS